MILAYVVCAGNIHNSQLFPEIFRKVQKYDSQYIITDSGYKAPTIAYCLLSQGVGVIPIYPYTRPKSKIDMLRPKDFIYREYKSDPKICEKCPLLHKCIQSKNHQTVITRHVWQDSMEK